MRIRRNSCRLPPHRLADAVASGDPGPLRFAVSPEDLTQIRSQEYSVAATDLGPCAPLG